VAQFKCLAADMFENFQATERHLIMMNIFQQEIDINYYKQTGIILDHFPAHTEDKKQIDGSFKRYRWPLIRGFLF